MVKKKGKGKSAPDPRIVEMNSRHAFVMIGGRATIINEEFNEELGHEELTFSSSKDMRERYANRRVLIGTGANPKSISLADFWLKHLDRRQYDRLTFLPGQEAPPNVYNLWRGFPFKAKKGSWKGLRAHIREVIAQGDEEIERYLLDWMAHAVQRPYELPETAIALRGRQGTGKGLLWREFGKLFGQHFLQVDRPEALIGRFNMHLAHKLVVFADEAFLIDDKKSAGALKARITEPELAFEAKGKDIVRLRNYTRIVAASNESWVVPAGLDERRWCVLDVSDTRVGDRDYFSAIVKEMENGGREAMLYSLLHRNISAFDPAKFPATSALMDNIIQGLDPIDAWWFGKLQAGTVLGEGQGWPEYHIASEVLADIEDSLKNMRRPVPTKAALGRRLRALIPGLSVKQRRVPLYEKSIPNFKCYEFPPLEECRKAFQARTRIEIDWEEEMDATDVTEDD